MLVLFWFLATRAESLAPANITLLRKAVKLPANFNVRRRHCQASRKLPTLHKKGFAKTFVFFYFGVHKTKDRQRKCCEPIENMFKLMLHSRKCFPVYDYQSIQVSAAWMTGQRQSQLVATNVSMYLLLWTSCWRSWGPVSRIAFAAIELEIKFWGNVYNAWLGWTKILDTTLGRVSATDFGSQLQKWSTRRLTYVFGGPTLRLRNWCLNCRRRHFNYLFE